MKTLALSKRPNLTAGQKVLFDTTCQKVTEGTSLTYPEAREMFVLYGCQETRDGVPYYTDYWAYQDEKGEWKCQLKPMTEDMARIATLQWLTRNIGSLVLKGYLKVLPVLELE